MTGHDVDAFAKEISDLHDFFEAWFEGDNSRSITEFSDRLDAGFSIVTPNGARLGKAAIMDAVETRFGSGRIRIATVDARLNAENPGSDVDGDTIDGSYVEVQTTRTGSTRRHSEVTMALDSTVPTGYRWIRVVETWLDSEDSQAARSLRR